MKFAKYKIAHEVSNYSTKAQRWSLEILYTIGRHLVLLVVTLSFKSY